MDHTLRKTIYAAQKKMVLDLDLKVRKRNIIQMKVL